MTWWNSILSVFSSDLADAPAPLDSAPFVNHEINPANGLPMIDAIDIAGNPYGMDLSHESHDFGLHSDPLSFDSSDSWSSWDSMSSDW